MVVTVPGLSLSSAAGPVQQCAQTVIPCSASVARTHASRQAGTLVGKVWAAIH
jgi:hypothetical protein